MTTGTSVKISNAITSNSSSPSLNAIFSFGLLFPWAALRCDWTFALIRLSPWVSLLPFIRPCSLFGCLPRLPLLSLVHTFFSSRSQFIWALLSLVVRLFRPRALFSHSAGFLCSIWVAHCSFFVLDRPVSPTWPTFVLGLFLRAGVHIFCLPRLSKPF